jgi:hypothetical protein
LIYQAIEIIKIMKVFLSWSGERSHKLAIALSDWLPMIINSIEPYISSKIKIGSRWIAELETNLNESEVGIICLTKDSLQSQWLFFEAGAISKSVENNLVCPYLLDIEPDEIPSPLTQFQYAKANKDDTWKLVCSINEALREKSISEEVLKRSFKNSWNYLEKFIISIPPLSTKIKSNQVILDDAKYLQILNMHQASIAFRISTVIDNSLYLLEKDPNNFDSEDFFREIHAAILEGRDLCHGFVNKKIGVLVNFFEQDFSKDELREITKSMEVLLLDTTVDPIAKRTRFFRKIRSIQREVYERSLKILQGEIENL